MASPLPFDRPNRFILVWPGERREAPIYGGQQIMFPSRDEIAVPYDKNREETHGSPFRYGAAKDRQGNPIPGTIVLQDSIERDLTNQNVVRTFDAQNWIRGLHGIMPRLFERGLTAVTEPEDVPAAMEAGIQKWIAAEIDSWHEEVATESARRAKYEQKNQVPPPLQPAEERSLRRAVEGLKSASAMRPVSSVSNDDLIEAQGGKRGLKLASPAKPAPPINEVEPTPEKEPDKRVIAEGLFKTAEENNVTLSKGQLKGLLTADLAVMQEVAELLESKGVSV